MEITRSSIDTQKGPADWFTGDVYIDAVGTYTVTFSGTDRTIATMFVAPGATLNVSANTLTINGASTSATSAA